MDTTTLANDSIIQPLIGKNVILQFQNGTVFEGTVKHDRRENAYYLLMPDFSIVITDGKPKKDIGITRKTIEATIVASDVIEAIRFAAPLLADGDRIRIFSRDSLPDSKGKTIPTHVVHLNARAVIDSAGSRLEASAYNQKFYRDSELVTFPF